MENIEKTELGERAIISNLVAKLEIKYEFKTLDGNLVQCKELNELPWTANAHQFTIEKCDITKDFPIWFSHSTLIALLHYIDFKTVLDIGCGEGLASKIFKFLGKQVTTIEPGDSDPRLSEFEPIEIDFKKDYLTLNFDKKFDVIWTSHVLEHIRNPGIFLDKIFNDLNEGGTLALTVPYFELNDPEFIVDSHINKFSIGTMIYHLIAAGFDCKNISIAVNSWELCVLLKKVSNGLQQTSSAKGLAEIKNFLPNLNVHHTFRSDGSLQSFKFEKDSINWPTTEKQC